MKVSIGQLVVLILTPVKNIGFFFKDAMENETVNDLADALKR